MTALRDIQQTFLADLYTGRQDSLPFIHPNHHHRLSVYQNNTFLGLVDLLKGTFPVVAQIVGDGFFQTLTRHYYNVYPLACGNRHTFGQALPRFLTTFAPAAALPYVPEMAALEWALFQAEIAPDAPAATFGDLTPETLADPDFCLSLHPSVQIIPTNHNVLEIWQAHQDDMLGTLNLKNTPCDILVIRNPDYGVTARPITSALKAFMETCGQGQPLALALSETLNHHPDAEASLQEFFAAALTQGAFTLTSERKCL
jgi:hypothetical protein